MKSPSVYSVCSTARVVSRKLKKAGFTIYKEWSRITGPSIDGYWVRREGSGKRVAVSYLGYNDRLKYLERKQKENLAYEFLRAEGYLIDENGYIQCETSY
jgi:hypothetical protein